MALSVKVGSFAMNTVTGNKAITGVGFQPKLVLFWGIDVTAVHSNPSGDSSEWLGAAISSSSRFSLAYTDNNGTNAGRQDNTKCIIMQKSGSNVLIMAADLVTLDADGFTINITTAPASAYLVNYMAIGGADLTNVFIKQFRAPAVTGSNAQTGVGFKPDALMVFTNSSALNPPTNLSEGDMGYGFGTSSSNRVSMGFGPGNTYYSATHIISTINNAGSTQLLADLTSLDTDGFTLNFGTTTASAYIWAVCLKGGKYKAGSTTQKTGSTGNQAITGIGFTPTGLFISEEGALNLDISQAQSNHTTGFASDTTHRAYTWIGDNNFTNSDEWLEQAKVVADLSNGATPIINAEADLNSFDADGFTLNWTTISNSANNIIYFAMGSNPVGFTWQQLIPDGQEYPPEFDYKTEVVDY